MKYKCQNGWTKEDMIAHVFLNFKGRSVRKYNCLYRGPKGKQCAVGMFIPDEQYTPEMEGKVPNTDTGSLFKSIKFPLKLHAMDDFQTSHDNARVNDIYCQDDDGVLASIIEWIETNVA